MSLEETELSKNAGTAGINSTTTGLLLEQQFGNTWDPKQIKYMTDKEKKALSDLKPDASSADKLMELLGKRYANFSLNVI